MATICEKCGSTVDNRDTACPVCGFPLDPDPTEETRQEKTVSKFHFASPRQTASKPVERDENFGSGREWTDRPKAIDDEPSFVMSGRDDTPTSDKSSDRGPYIDDFRSDTFEKMYPGRNRAQKDTLKDIEINGKKDTSRELEKVLGKVKLPSKEGQGVVPEEEAPQAPKAVAPRPAPPPVPRTPTASIPKLRPKADALLKKPVTDNSTPAWVQDDAEFPETDSGLSKSFEEKHEHKPGFKLEAPVEPQYKNVKPRPAVTKRKPSMREIDESDTLPIMSSIREKEEHVEEIQVVAANFPARAAAGAIDQFIVLLVSYIFVSFTIWIMGEEYIPESKGILSLLTDYPVILPSCATIYLFIFLLYTVWMNSVTGQTVGKMLLKLRLVQMDGERPHPLRAVIRQAAYFISLLVLGLGYFLVLFDPRKQSLHDKIAGTLVIRCTE